MVDTLVDVYRQQSRRFVHILRVWCVCVCAKTNLMWVRWASHIQILFNIIVLGVLVWVLMGGQEWLERRGMARLLKRMNEERAAEKARPSHSAFHCRCCVC